MSCAVARLSLDVKAWTISIVLALAVTFLLRATGFLSAPVMIATALATTAIGTLLPILRDSGELKTRFGTLVLGAGAVGELGPVLVVSLILTHEHTTWQQTFLLLAFASVALAAAIAALRLRLRPIVRLLERTLHASSQLPVRICILLMVGLVMLAHEFGLDLILGAFAAGMVVRLASEGEKGEVLREKLEAIGYGFLVPLFFVVSGIKFNLGSLLESTDALLRVPFFLALFLLVRGSPSLLFYRKDLAEGRAAALHPLHLHGIAARGRHYRHRRGDGPHAQRERRRAGGRGHGVRAAVPTARACAAQARRRCCSPGREGETTKMRCNPITQAQCGPLNAS